MSDYFSCSSKNYLSCTKMHIIDAFYRNGVSVDYLFFNTFEDTRSIYKEVIEEKKPRDRFETRTTEFYELMGIKKVECWFNCFAEAEVFVHQKLSEEKELFIYTRNKFIPHMMVTPNGIHSLVLSQYDKAKDSFLVRDVPIISSVIYDSLYIRDGFDDAIEDSGCIFYFDYDDYKINSDSITFYENEFKKTVMNMDDDFLFYEKIADMLQRNVFSDVRSSFFEETYALIDHAFAIVAGSRFLCSKFLQVMGYSDVVIRLMIQSSNFSEIIKNMILKIRFSGKGDTDAIIKKCMNLMQLEKYILRSIQEEICGGTMALIEQRTAPAALSLECRVVTDTNALIAWRESADQGNIISYEIYQDANLIGATSSSGYNVPGLLPGSTYEFAVKTRDLYGNLSAEAAVISITTLHQNETDNLALHKPVYSSSNELSVFDSSHVVDGDPGTRWSSKNTESQWICIDLGIEHAIGRIVLRWEAAYAVSYKIQVSKDDLIWTDLYENKSGAGGIEDIQGLCGTGRYIKLHGMERVNIEWGYSLWEFSVYSY